MKTFLAIDFGTSQTSVAMLHESSRYEPEIVEIDGQRAVPTALHLDADGKVLFFGQDAIDKFHDDAGQTFYNFKAFIGKENDYQNATGQTSYTPEDLSLTFLTCLREKIERKYLNGAKLAEQPDMYCVIGCPAEWNDVQKKKVEGLARQAGFPNVTYCEEPLGAIYYYHFRGDLDLSKEQNVLVYDFGGGTTDVAIEKVHANSEGVVGVDVLAASGLTNIGGMYFDRALSDFFIKKLNLDEAVLSMRDRQQIERYSRILKENLSRRVEDGQNSAEVSIPMLRATRSTCTLSITTDEFNDVCAEFIAQFDDPVFDALNFSALVQDKVDRVILAGGSSALPYVKERITAIFPTGKVLTSTSPTEIIAKGLAVYGRFTACGDKFSLKVGDLSIQNQLPLEKKGLSEGFSLKRTLEAKPKTGRNNIFALLAFLAALVPAGRCMAEHVCWSLDIQWSNDIQFYCAIIGLIFFVAGLILSVFRHRNAVKWSIVAEIIAGITAETFVIIRQLDWWSSIRFPSIMNYFSLAEESVYVAVSFLILCSGILALKRKKYSLKILFSSFVLTPVSIFAVPIARSFYDHFVISSVGDIFIPLLASFFAFFFARLDWRRMRALENDGGGE